MLLMDVQSYLMLEKLPPKVLLKGGFPQPTVIDFNARGPLHNLCVSLSTISFRRLLR